MISTEHRELAKNHLVEINSHIDWMPGSLNPPEPHRVCRQKGALPYYNVGVFKCFIYLYIYFLVMKQALWNSIVQ
jgi:hypothetical protein